jgi:hypothetical protein
MFSSKVHGSLLQCQIFITRVYISPAATAEEFVKSFLKCAVRLEKGQEICGHKYQVEVSRSAIKALKADDAQF